MARERLSDTEALSRQGIRPAGSCFAAEQGMFSPDGFTPALGSADRAVATNRQGQFQRVTGAGNESLANAVKVAGEGGESC